MLTERKMWALRRIRPSGVNFSPIPRSNNRGEAMAFDPKELAERLLWQRECDVYWDGMILNPLVSKYVKSR